MNPNQNHNPWELFLAHTVFLLSLILLTLFPTDLQFEFIFFDQDIQEEKIQTVDRPNYPVEENWKHRLS